MPDHDASDAPPSADAVIEVLSEALRGRTIPRSRTFASGGTASADEGLALVQGFLTIHDPRVRQAVLHAVAALAVAARS